ncbi:MAG: hypothetical protein QOH25_1420 [Acidobacteriota bacterium]|jgi:hypothetical protein|nr:hypothetical protein [Acidobacteriota bacterium]
MATKKKAGSKKGSSRKLAAAVANDPPIVVSGGGGGVAFPKIRRPARNLIEVGFEPEGGPGHGKFKAKTNKATEITGARIDFPGMTGLTPITIPSFEFYNIQITFLTNPEPPRSSKSGAKASGKGKTSAKRPAAS